MTDKQFHIAFKLLENIHDLGWISYKDYDHLLFILEVIYEEENLIKAEICLDSLETLPREKGYQILKTVGFRL